MMRIPQHVAVILDGNGRWAKSKGMPRAYGHIQGAKNVEKICDAADELGIRFLTFYAFSTENWNRPKAEVAALMKLFREYLKTSVDLANRKNMRARVIGDVTGLDVDMQEMIRDVEASSRDNTGLNFTVAVNYGSRDEIRRAVADIGRRVKDGDLDPDEIDEDMISKSLDTADIPDPDLLIRTSGEQRLSNYLLWQLAYAELYFTDVPWPAFTKEELQKAIEAYNRRERRFGKVSSTEGE